jgi:group I intron endonuclease
MGYIYKISCLQSDNIYIGKTESSVEERWKEHYKASANPNHKDYDLPIHRAIRKYGKENFIIEKIDNGVGEELKQKEKYWIKYYNSYFNGYNATLGGDG